MSYSAAALPNTVLFHQCQERSASEGMRGCEYGTGARQRRKPMRPPTDAARRQRTRGGVFGEDRHPLADAADGQASRGQVCHSRIHPRGLFWAFLALASGKCGELGFGPIAR